MTGIRYADIITLLEGGREKPDADSVIRRYIQEGYAYPYREARFLLFLGRCYISIKDAYARQLVLELLKLMMPGSGKQSYNIQQLQYVGYLLWYTRGANSLSAVSKRLKNPATITCIHQSWFSSFDNQKEE